MVFCYLLLIFSLTDLKDSVDFSTFLIIFVISFISISRLSRMSFGDVSEAVACDVFAGLGVNKWLEKTGGVFGRVFGFWLVSCGAAACDDDLEVVRVFEQCLSRRSVWHDDWETDDVDITEGLRFLRDFREAFGVFEEALRGLWRKLESKMKCHRNCEMFFYFIVQNKISRLADYEIHSSLIRLLNTLWEQNFVISCLCFYFQCLDGRLFAGFDYRYYLES